MGSDTGQDTRRPRVTIREAAARLGVTEAAIRKRIQRGSSGKGLGEDGRVYVYLDLSRDMSHPESQVDRDLLVEDLREQVRYLRSVFNEERDARRRADTIIAQLTQANAALLGCPSWSHRSSLQKALRGTWTSRRRPRERLRGAG